MARRPIDKAPMEPRGSIVDPRVMLVPVPNARRLVVVDDLAAVPASAFAAAIVWIRPSAGVSDQQLIQVAEVIAAAGALCVRMLPRDAEDVDVPADAGSPALLSHVSEVRPVVAELLAELPEELSAAVGEFVEDRLSEAGL